MATDSLYYPGVTEALAAVRVMDLPALLQYVDQMYGRGNLAPGATEDEVRAEALAQCRRDFTNTASTAYRDVTFWRDVLAHQAGRLT